MHIDCATFLPILARGLVKSHRTPPPLSSLDNCIFDIVTRFSSSQDFGSVVVVGGGIGGILVAKGLAKNPKQRVIFICANDCFELVPAIFDHVFASDPKVKVSRAVREFR